MSGLNGLTFVTNHEMIMLDNLLYRAKTNHSNSSLFVLNQIFDAVGVDLTFYRRTLQW